MAVNVTMLQTRRGEDGNLWAAGSSYSATDAFAAFLITGNLATGTMPAVPQSGISPAGGIALNALVSEAWMSGAINALIGFHPTRVYLDSQPLWLDNSPILS